MKTLADLNSRIWYRLLKVIYIVSLFVVTTITVFITYTYHEPTSAFKVVDHRNTKIICNYGNKRTFIAGENEIYFAPADFSAEYFPNNIRESVNELCDITQEIVFELMDADMRSEATMPLFTVKEKYESIGGYAPFIFIMILETGIIFVIFELMKRAFYYVAIGTMKPPRAQ